MSEADREGLGELALRKLERVFGAERGRALFDSVLVELGLRAVATPDDLARVASALERRGGFVTTVGTMLAVVAAMRKLELPPA
jgi:hypothetical protein